MPSFAFWNVFRKDLSAEVCRLARHHDLDLIALCESRSDPDRIVAGLNRLPGNPYVRVKPKLHDRFQVFSRFRPDLVNIALEQERYTILKVHSPSIPVFNLMLLHGESPGSHWNDPSISHSLITMAQDLRQLEESDKNYRSIVVGDFNQNPFADGMVSALGFHAVMDQREARKGHRLFRKKRYPYFYNPMWNLFGDGTPGPPGTHYYRGPGLVEQQWHMLDQILVRPSLLDYFDHSKVEILTAFDGLALAAKSERPRKKVSDHFPLYFELNPY